MIELRDPGEPVWLELPHGVRLLCAVNDPVAEMAGRQVFYATFPPAESDETPDIARARFLEALELAHRSVTAWEGVAADFSPANLARLLHMPDMAVSFLRERGRARDVWSAEGNASATSPSGTGDEAADAPSAPAAGT